MSDNNLRLQVVLNAVDKITRPFRAAQSSTKGLTEAIRKSRDQLKTLNEQAGRIDGFRKASSQLAVTGNNLRAAREEAAKLSRQFAQINKPTAQQARLLLQAKNRVNELQQSYNGLRQSVQRQRLALNSAGIDTRKLSDAQRRLKADTGSATLALARQKEQLKTLGVRQAKINAAREKYNTGNQQRAMVAGMGFTSIATGRTMFNDLKQTLNVGYDFDAIMSKTQAVTRLQDKNNPEMAALRQQARTLPLKSKFTDMQVAEGQYYLGRTGYSATQIQGAMPGILNLATAGDIDLGTTADIASNIQTAMGIPAEKMDRVADVLTALFTRNNVDIPMLGESLKYSAGVGREYGQSLETIAAATSMLGSTGIQGSQAGTAMRSILSRLGTSKAVANLGISTKDNAGNMRDMVDILKDINKKTAGMGNIDRAQIFKNIAGVNAVTGFSILMRAAGNGSLERMRGRPGEYDGEAARVSKTMLDNMAGDTTMLQAALENISVELFEKNNSWLRGLAQSITDVLHGVSEFLKAHPAFSKAFVILGAVIAGATALFGGLMFAIVGLLAPITLLRFQFSMLGIKGVGAFGLLRKSLGAVGSGILWLGKLMWANPILAVIGLIAAGAIYLWQNWETLGPKFQRMWDAISSAVSGAWSVIRQTISQKWDEIVNDIAALSVKFKQAGGAIIDGILRGINEKWESLKSKLTSVKNYLPDWITGGDHSSVKPQTAGNPGTFAGMYDSGGYIPRGRFGIAGENGPEIISGPVNITSRRRTAALASMVASVMGLAAIPAADAVPLHPFSLPANAYSMPAENTGFQSAVIRYEINAPIQIITQAGQNAQDIAREVARQLNDRERKARAKARSNFSDQGGYES
ncbi:phage tail tape measure protein [Tatumella saanichensis]|uniref:phage tail tape measure protein n=1 Tax=Tatumella saanichensis TaxID=480813 RepID=UPI0004A33AC0|nr:phage tail tape measure protein [Tatumella saanichensis]